MPRIKICKAKDCRNAQTTGGYCRLHYLQNWKKIKLEQKKKAAKNLNRYVESIMRRNPDRFVEEIKKDIRSRDFGERVEEEYGGSSFGETEDSWTPFDTETSDEEISDIVSHIKSEKDF